MVATSAALFPCVWYSTAGATACSHRYITVKCFSFKMVPCILFPFIVLPLGVKLLLNKLVHGAKELGAGNMAPNWVLANSKDDVGMERCLVRMTITFKEILKEFLNELVCSLSS